MNPVTSDSTFTLTVNNGNQLNIASTGQTAAITIDTGSNTLNLPSDINVSGTTNLTTLTTNNIVATSASITTLTATIINPSPTYTTNAGSSEFCYVVMPFTGSGYKKVLLLFSSYVPGAALETFDFPVSFTGQYLVSLNPNNLQYTLESGSLTITNFSTSTTYNMVMSVEG